MLKKMIIYVLIPYLILFWWLGYIKIKIKHCFLIIYLNELISKMYTFKTFYAYILIIDLNNNYISTNKLITRVLISFQTVSLFS